MADGRGNSGRFERHNPGLEFDRAAFFSDAVYAIAMTLLVVGIGVPHVRDATLGKKLASLDGEIITFFVGFTILGFYWLSHHALVARLRAVDTTFLVVNLMYLAIIAFLPFPTAVVGNNGDAPLAVVVFGLALAVVSILEIVIYLCAHAHDLIADPPLPAQHRHDIMAGLLPAAIVLLSLPIALVNTRLTMLCWILIIPAEQILDRVIKPEPAPNVGDDAETTARPD